MRQYLDIKDQHPDAMLFFRLGDFYEMFFEDAVIGARLLDLTLTTRDKGKEDAVPMCGVPHHAARGYIAKLTELGHKVVMCEQTEDPKLAKGLVKREVVRIITPGIVLDDDVLEPKLPRYVVALVPAAKSTGPRVVKPAGGALFARGTLPGGAAEPSFARGTVPGREAAPISEALRDPSAMCGLAYLDATTGELAATELPMTAVVDELVRIAPREIVCAPELLVEGSRLAAVRARYKTAWNPAPIPDDTGARGELAALWIVDPAPDSSGPLPASRCGSLIRSRPARPPR
ncbi:MAG: hypothetical protein WKG01_22740 [Kofleriaceae bacterium]